MAWLPLESNPDVMNKFMRLLGVSEKWNVVDVYGLDNESLGWIPRPVLAVILLYPSSDKHSEEINEKNQEIPSSIYFMKQVVSNACGTVALIHSIANNTDQINLSDGLFKKILEESSGMDPEARGELLQKTCGDIVNAHRELAMEGQTEVNPNEEVVHHFVAFVHKDGNLYELDGRKPSPINHGPTSPDSLLEDAAKVCQEFFKREADNIKFTVMALTAAGN